MSLTRRNFLGGSAAFAAGCVAVPQHVSNRRDPALAALISDLHINGTQATHTSAELAKTVAAILALDPLPARVVVLGDTADAVGLDCDYAAAEPILKPLADAGLTFDWMMGNHDKRAAFARFRPDYAASTRVPGRLVHVVALPQVDLVLMDSLMENPEEGAFSDVNGEIDAAQTAWLAAYGAAAKRPYLVCAHHDGRQMKPFAKAAMASSPRMCGYLHGHRHSWMPDTLHAWSPARIVRSAGLPSAGAWGDIGFALLRDLGDRAELKVVTRDFFFPKPAARREPVWDTVRAETQGASVIFPYGVV